MFDLLFQFIFGSTPVASAEALEAQAWTPKTPQVTEVEVILKKEDILSSTTDELYWVVAVLDGDTILVSGPDRELFQVRLLAVDTNEVNGPDSTAECYGTEATLFTMDFLKNRAVTLSADPANEDEDPYGRKLRFVEVLQEDGSFASLNEALLREGYATFPEQYPLTSPTFFATLEQEARDANKGLWGKCE